MKQVCLPLKKIRQNVCLADTELVVMVFKLIISKQLGIRRRADVAERQTDMVAEIGI